MLSQFKFQKYSNFKFHKVRLFVFLKFGSLVLNIFWIFSSIHHPSSITIAPLLPYHLSLLLVDHDDDDDATNVLLLLLTLQSSSATPTM
jgi:hypothetical protein